MAYQQSIRRLLPTLLDRTNVKYFDNCIYISQQEEGQLRYLKRQVAHDLFELTGKSLLNRDCWNIITDILFSQHSETMYSIIRQVSAEYRTSMLPFLTAPEPITKPLLIKMAHEMEINLILHKAQICPEFVVRLKQFHIDLINLASETTWVVSACKVDCFAASDNLGYLLDLIDDPAIHIEPVDIEDEFLLTLNTASDDSAFTDSFMQMLYNFYYDGGAQLSTRNNAGSFNVPLELWGGEKASISTNQITLELFIAQCVKISTSVNGILYLVHQEEKCYCCITRFPNEHFYICVLDSNGSLSMPSFRRDVLLTYQKRKTSYFIAKWGHQMLH